MDYLNQSTTIIVESDIKNSHEIHEDLVGYSKKYSHIQRKLFNFLKNEKDPSEFKNQFQRDYIETFDIQARVFKSIWIDSIGRVQAIKSNLINYKNNTQLKIDELEDIVKSLNSKKPKDYKFKIYNIKNKINKLNLRLKNR